MNRPLTLDTMFRPLTADEIATAAPDHPALVPDWRPILPVPNDAPPLTNVTINQHAPAGFAFVAGWRYNDANGRLLGAVVRYDKPANGSPAEKQVKPFAFCEGPNGVRAWRCKGFPAPRPLYGLDKLAARPDAPVIVTEGEKAADAAAERFPDHVVLTSPGGSSAANKTDWSPLKGRAVTIWPDRDDAGTKYADEVARLVVDADALSTAIVTVPTDWPAAWDLADDLPEGVTADDLVRMLDGAQPAGGWETPTPIMSSLPPVQPFAPEMLPEALRGYVFDVADRQQSVPDFVAVAALCGLAAVVGNRVRVAPKQHDDWIEVPNLWGAIIGPPSAMKSPAMQSALGPVYALQDEMRETWKADLDAADVNEMLGEFETKAAKKKAGDAFKAGDRDAARAILAAVSKDDDDEPPCPRVVVNDATVEKLGELLNENPRGLLLVRDELPGWLARMESEEYAGERAFYLESFNGSGRFTYDRIGRGTVHISSCTLSIIGGVQPARIAPLVRGTMTGASNDGLIQRLQLAVWPDIRKSWTWVDRHPDKAARAAYEKVFRDLHGLQLGTPDEPAVLRFSPAAQDMFRAWMEEIQTDARRGDLSPVLESHLLKMPKIAASLALLFELIEGGRFEVGEYATALALEWADYLRSHANRLYSSGNTMIEDGARLILERRHQLSDEFTVRSVHQKDWAGLADRETVIAAIELLVATHHCREVEKPGSMGRGRPTATYNWNPALREA